MVTTRLVRITCQFVSQQYKIGIIPGTVDELKGEYEECIYQGIN